jgi:hypothetical protein
MRVELLSRANEAAWEVRAALNWVMSPIRTAAGVELSSVRGEMDGRRGRTLDDLQVGEESGFEHGLTESRTLGNLSHQKLDDDRELAGLLTTTSVYCSR